MCGRINVSEHEGVQELLRELGLSLEPVRFEPAYNVPPTSNLWTAIAGPQLLRCHWGLVPPWARPGRFSGPLINARAESAWDKPSFRKLIAASRAVIPVNGFYEWKRQGRSKSAYYIRPGAGLARAGGFALAGLYQVSADGEPQCCVLTTAANRPMRSIHDRMPVILPPGHLADWLNLGAREAIDAFLRPA